MKKLTALLLSITMVLSMFTNILPIAYADGEGVSASEDANDRDYNDIVTTRQPGLYIDFLGDNRKYLPKTSADVASGPAAPGLVDQSAVTNPGDSRTWTGYKTGETDGTNSLYQDYTGKDTIFWIGVGIDKMDEFDLFQQGSDGIYSLELGFYYDNRYIEPYLGPDTAYTISVSVPDPEDPGKTITVMEPEDPKKIQTAYEQVIRGANLGNYAQYHWENYHIVSAETGLAPQTDPVTQETLKYNKTNSYAPDIEGIMNGEAGVGSNTWRMTYVAIERDPGATNRSFVTAGDKGTKYLLIIPFRLKAHDANYTSHLCLRLARNAGMFSIGGGNDGASPYAAWERTTVRNPGRELKLMANFQGDLNIFNGQRIQDELYDAALYLDDGGGSGNGAKLSVDGDPSTNPTWIQGKSLSTRTIKNLPAGTGMKIDIAVQTGYEARVSVYPLNETNNPQHYILGPLTWNDAAGTFRFVMPDKDVRVDVIFAITDNKIFNLYLDEHLTEDGKRPGEVPVVSGKTVMGNDTVLTASYPGNPTPVPSDPTAPAIPPETVIVDKNSPHDLPLDLPGEQVTIEAGIKTSLEVDMKLHADYYAEVELFQISSGGNIRPDNASAPWFSVGTDNVITVTSDGVLTLAGMPRSDMIVRVNYKLAKRVTGALEVWHENVQPEPKNVAQLRTAGYNDDNESMPAYSGVVYQDDKGTRTDLTDLADDNHRTVETPFRVLEQVEAQAALLSGSLGGDGNTPVPWLSSTPAGGGTPVPDPNSMMAVLYKATSATDLAGKINAYDLRKLAGTGMTKGDGLRKNARGEYYTDSEMDGTDGFYARLLEVKALIDAEVAAAAGGATASGVSVVDVLDSNDSTKTLFSYYDLTPDQLQAYLLDYEKYQKDYEKYQADLAAGSTTATAPVVLVLRADSDAKAALGSGGSYGEKWYDPKDDHGTRPPTTPKPLDQTNGYKLETRVGRQMAVVLEASSVYTMLNSVEIFEADTYDPATGTGTRIATAVRDPDYQNVYLFTVPNEDYIVKVTYVEREVRKLNLSISIPIGDEETGNETTVTAFAPDPNSPAARKVVKSKYTKGVEPVAAVDDRILVGSTVTVQVKKVPGYKASAQVVTLPGSAAVGTTPTNVSNLSNAITVFTFTMPATGESTEIQITYTRDVETHNANLILAGDTNGGTGVWQGTTSMIRPSVEGDKLRAEIEVQPGYYILSAEAYTASGAYPFTMSGNGWNNGAGGHVTVDTIMPDAEYYVRITFAKGPPPEEDLMALTLQVMDPDNTATPYADNYAQAQAGTGTGAVRLGPVGLARTGLFPAPAGTVIVPGSAGPDTKMVRAGELVEVEYAVQPGYALQSIVVEPVGLGITPTYVTDAGGNVRARFIMPSASARVVVTFRKTENIKDRLFLNLNKTENGVLATETNRGEAGNTVTWVKSDTFDKNTALGADRKYGVTGVIPTTVPRREDSAITTGVANPGEKVSFDITTATGWYVHSLTLTDGLGNRLSYSMNTVGGEQVVSLVMPASDVTAIVNYRQGTPPDPDHPKDTDSDRLLELVVLDPDNTTAPYADNWTQAEVSGATTATLGALGLAKGSVRDEEYVKPGDLVTIQYDAVQPGYTLEVITVTTDGSNGTSRTIMPVYTASNTATTPGVATFTMPNANVTATVRFRAVTEEKPVQEYTANLILHFPAGMNPADYDKVGEGTFGKGVRGADDHIQNRYYSRTALPGETIDFTAWAKDGYYIQRVTVTPAALNVDADMAGAFGWQNGSLVMPAADVLVNVFFVKLDEKKEWPKEVPYTLNLEVHDASGLGGTANFGSIKGTALTAPDNDKVGDGERKTLTDYNGGTQIHERDRVFVALTPAPGTYVRSVVITDSRGRSVPWNYVPGGIAFDMPPAHVTVTVYYAQGEGQKHEVTLYIRKNRDADGALLALDSDPTNKKAETNNDKIAGLAAGDTLTLTVDPDRTGGKHHSVESAYVVVYDGTGRPVVIPTTGLLPSTATTQTGMPLVADGGAVQFAMPDADAEVYVVFTDEGVPAPGDLTGSLMVMGPDGSGSAVMSTVGGIGSKPGTGTVAASGGGTLFAPENTELTVDLDVKSGYAISSILVVDGQGDPVPYTWTDGAQRQFTLKMAPTGVRVYVELEKVDVTKELTVQVVVNNAGDARNTAKLRLGTTAVGGGVAILNPVYPGNEIFLDLEVQTGYKIGSIQVVPAKFGIAPSLSKKNTEDQTTSFTMPGEDLVVYVHFEPDNRTRYTATLVTEGYYNDNNQAKIHSDFSGWTGWVSPIPSTVTSGKDRTSVRAAPATATDPAEWVTVDYRWDVTDSSVESITVTLTDGTVVPFTQNSTDLINGTGRISFPMVDGNVTVTVKYRNDPEPVGYVARIHVIDMDNDTEITDHSWGKLTWTDRTTGEVKAKHPFPGNEAEIKVPAGQTVTVDADTVNSGVYLWAGYVIYRQGGQMINFNFTPNTSGVGFSGGKTADFVMHPGVNDVYIYFTKTEPNDTDYSAVLMVDSPAADKTSSATMTTSGNSGITATDSTTVIANTPPDHHGYIIATKGDTITVTVNPAAGYAIDSVLMTPLGVADDSGIPIVPVRTGNTYTFTMPGQNVAILVKLKTSSAGEHTATLHYASADPGDTTFTKDLARANLYFDQGFTDVDGGQLKVDENTQMTLDVLINNRADTKYQVMAAYVLQPNGTMVPLDNALEGTKDTVAGVNGVDGTAGFKMPASDVDVYVWFTQRDMPEKWHTAVLVVTDEKGTDLNKGLNSARFWSDKNNPDLAQEDTNYEKLPHFVKSLGVRQPESPAPGGVATHGFFWVEEGETVTVKINPPADGYIFSREATISHSDALVGAGITLNVDDQKDPEFVYTYKVGDCNSAVHAHFVASNIVQNKLEVVAIDRDNPGGDRNTVEVTPASMPQLTLVSITSAGARQVIPGVISNAMVNFTVKPDEGYTAVAHLVVGGVRKALPLTAGTGGSTGYFTMPDKPARLEITFMREEEALQAKLSIIDTRAPDGMTTDVSTAKMTENAFGGEVEASTAADTDDTFIGYTTKTKIGKFDALPNGTALTAWAETPLAAGTKEIGGVLITDQGSRVLPSAHNATTNVDEYYHTLSGRNAEIRIVVGPENEENYIASVTAVNKPAAIGAPTIAVTPTPNPVSGGSWTVARAGDGITVTLDVPYGYRADLTVDGTDGTALSTTSIDGTDAALLGQTVTLTPNMPARNVHITVTYVKTRFDATVATGGNGQGTATLTDGTTMITATSTPLTTDTLHGVKVAASLDYTATAADANSVLTDGFWTSAGGGVNQRVNPLDKGTVVMPADDATYTAIFQDKDNVRHKAYVVVDDPAHLPLNKAISIKNTTVDLGGGLLYAFGDGTHVMETSFTTEPGYYAVVTAERDDGTTTSVPVVQVGFTGAGTATLIMPADVDVKVTITYSTVLPPREHNLSLQLVGADGNVGNNATLTLVGGTAALERRGTNDYDPVTTTAGLGASLDLDINRYRDNTVEYYIERVELTCGGVTVTYTPPSNNVNEYGTNATSLFTMPDGDTVVTVYFRLPFKATLFVVDAAGVDLPQSDTVLATNVPNTTMAVTDTSGANVPGSPTTFTHTPIEGLYGTETVTTAVDETTLPADTAVASVVASTGSGTVHLTRDASGKYVYPMSTPPTRYADNVDVTVILRDTTKPDMYTATVYKVGHDNHADNWASITNTTTTSGLPFGTKAGTPDWHDWTGAYEKDLLRVDVTTHTGYYAVVTAVRTGTTTPVPVLQWTATGPFDAQFYMPAADVDVTVTYSTVPPDATLTLKLVNHEQKAGNEGSVYDMTTAPGTLIPNLALKGTDAPDLNPVEKDSVNKVVGGTNLEVRAGLEAGYSIKSITMTIPGFTPISLTVSSTNTATTRMPVLTGGDKALITVEFEPGQKSPRPFDPEHSTIYNSGNYPVPETPTNPGNPNLSNPDQQGWLLAEPDDDRATGKILVTVPTLYDTPDPDKADTLYDAGVDPASTADPKPEPPVYKFYWQDDLGVYHELVEGTDIAISGKRSLAYADNPKGDYPKGTPQVQHFGYELTLTAISTSASPFATYAEDGGTIYITATRPDENESLMTQVIIPAPNYTATLHIVDVSSSLKNSVTMYVKDDTSYTPVTTDGGKIEKLHGKETLLTDVVMGDRNVKVVSVLAIPKKGSPTYLTLDGSLHYPFPMVRDDVDIVVTLANEDDELYTAAVVKVDPANEPGNTVRISNPTHPVLNRDTNDPARWTLAYEKDEIRVDATAVSGYRAVVTAVRKDNGMALNVLPASGAGTMVITLPDKMPASNIEITVTFEKVEQDNQSWVTLRLRMDSESGTLPIDPGNRADAVGVDAGGTAVNLAAEDRNNYSDTALMAAGTAGLTTTLATGYSIKDVGLTESGTTTSLTAAATGFTVPTASNIVVTVILKETKVTGRTPRPFDPAHSVNYPNADNHTGPGSHQNGYLLADNQGGSLVEITVPNLYDGDLHPAENVRYTLYAKINGVMVELIEGTDYDTVLPVAAVDYTHTSDSTVTDGSATWTGQAFTIQSLDPTGVLGEYVKNGGVIYITATAPGKDESAYTEVVIPADPKKDTGYTVTLRIIDETTGKNNEVQMQNANSGVTVPWTGNSTNTPTPVVGLIAGQITKLLGGELIRTEVTPDTGVTYTVMAHTSKGDVLLFRDPSGTERYRKNMPAEDMEIIVHFRDEAEHIHIAAVEKRGATAVAGNEAYITNTTDSTLNSGTIWTEGRCTDGGDKIQVKVTTAEGYYATVTLSYIDPVSGPVNETRVVLGSGNPTPLLVDFNMPDADVQVVVFFEQGRKSPRPYDPEHSEDYYSDLYQHNTPADQSTTHQEGWLLGENLGGGQAVVTIPTLWSADNGLEDATNADFTFYLPVRDASGTITGYTLLTEGVDYTLANVDPDDTSGNVFTTVTKAYRKDSPGSATTATQSYDGVTFILKEIKSGATSTSLLDGLLDSGLSLFVSATKKEAAIPPWVEGDMTELVIPSTGLRPFDPDRENDPNYEDHWIRAENRGDYLIVTVPLLNSPREDDPTSVDDDLHRFQLHLQVKGEDWKDDISGIVNVTDLLKIENVKGYGHPSNVNLLYDDTWDSTAVTDQWERYYENEVYNSTYRVGLQPTDPPYAGARFVVTILSDADIDADADITDKAAAQANAKILRDIFDNKGTMGTDKYRMYITSDETENVTDTLPDFRAMDYVDFEVPRYYTLTGILESYAPTHITTVSLYPFLGTSDPEADSDGYAIEPAFVQKHWEKEGVGLWLTNFTIQSSELMGEDRMGVGYQLVLEKAGHVPLMVPELQLEPATLDPKDTEQITFTLMAANADGDILYDEDDPSVEAIALFGGDVNADGYARMEDYTYIMSYIGGQWGWNRNYFDPLDLILRPTTVTKDLESIYYPTALPYWVDLDGDGYITSADLAIWNTPRNYNKKMADYIMPRLRTSGASFAMLIAEELLPELEELLALPEEELPPEEQLPEETAPPGEVSDGEDQPQEPIEPGENTPSEMPGPEPTEGEPGTEETEVIPQPPEEGLPETAPEISGEPDQEKSDTEDTEPGENEPEPLEPGELLPEPEPEDAGVTSTPEVDQNGDQLEEVSLPALATN